MALLPQVTPLAAILKRLMFTVVYWPLAMCYMLMQQLSLWGRVRQVRALSMALADWKQVII